MENTNIIVRIATLDDTRFAAMITGEMEASAKARGTGIAKRSPDYIRLKMEEGKAVIAITTDDVWVGFCYIEAWEHEKFVANSGLIVAPDFRKTGIAKSIKHKIFELSRTKYPDAKIFGLTTGLAVMKINSELGYEPVTYSELTDDEAFWKGCQSCVNYEILMSKGRKNCMCTAMLYDPQEKEKDKIAEPEPQNELITHHNGRGRRAKKRRRFAGNFNLYQRWLRYKEFVLVKGLQVRDNSAEKNESAGSFDKRKMFPFLNIFF